MRLAVIGSGYVGLVAGTCFADSGNDVTCVDIDPRKIAALAAGSLPIYEPGLEELVLRNVKEQRLAFTTDLAAAVAHSQVIFIAVGTPEGETGDADLQYVLAAARDIGRALTGYAVIVDKSTVPVGTADKVRATVAAETSHPFDIVSNPEFLKEGAALDDFLKPDRVVIGADAERARAIMAELYGPFVRTEKPILFMDTRSAELTKYAANAMLATRISFMNDIAALCEKVGADVDLVRKGLGSDSRIGYPFLFPGAGYGGSCLVGRESVLIRRGGEVSLTALEALFSVEAPPNDALGPIGVAPAGLEVLSWSPATPTGAFLPVTALTRRAYEGDLLEVRTRLGRRVRCTPDHPFVTRGGLKHADQLTNEDWLPLALGAPLDPSPEPRRFELLAAALAHGDLSRSAVYVRLGPLGRGRLSALGVTGFHDALAPLGNPPDAARVSELVRTGVLRLTQCDAADLPLEGSTYGTTGNKPWVPGLITADAAFWRCVGMYLADGRCTLEDRHPRLTWCFHPTQSPELVGEVARFCRLLGQKVEVRRSSTALEVSVSSRLLTAFWTHTLDLSADPRSHRLPNAIWAEPEAHRRALLSGLWAVAGSWSSVARGPIVTLECSTPSRVLADGVLRLLASLGVTAHYRVRRSPKCTVNTHQLVITGADQVERVLDFVAPHERADLLACLPPRGASAQKVPASWVQVLSATRKPFKGFVYSLEVPPMHTFITTGGLVVHNCFPKDVKALVATAREHGIEFDLLRAVERTNERQKKLLVTRVVKHFGDLSGRTFAVWGLAFKPKTDDMREAPSIEVIEGLLGKGAKVRAFDPVAMPTARRVLGSDRITFCERQYEALEGADALLIVTEWNEFRHPDFDRIKAALRQPVVFDGRNLFQPAKLRALGFTYFGVGR